jgi:hypothetical protein
MYEKDKKTMASVEKLVGVLESHRSTGLSSSNFDNESNYTKQKEPCHKRNAT